MTIKNLRTTLLHINTDKRGEGFFVCVFEFLPHYYVHYYRFIISIFLLSLIMLQLHISYIIYMNTRSLFNLNHTHIIFHSILLAHTRTLQSCDSVVVVVVISDIYCGVDSPLTSDFQAVCRLFAGGQQSDIQLPRNRVR